MKQPKDTRDQEPAREPRPGDVWIVYYCWPGHPPTVYYIGCVQQLSVTGWTLDGDEFNRHIWTKRDWGNEVREYVGHIDDLAAALLSAARGGGE